MGFPAGRLPQPLGQGCGEDFPIFIIMGEGVLPGGSNVENMWTGFV